MSVEIRLKKMSHFKGDLPAYQTPGASGFDVRAQIDQPLTVLPGQRVLVSTGLAFEIPEGYEIQARPRSGWAIKNGMTLLNTPGTIDSDYRGEVKVILINLGQEAVQILDQDRIAQFVVCPLLQVTMKEVADLSSSERGAGGFGSTGKR